MIFFFFQAEDGIRDIGVTGVQTCALPISGGGVHSRTAKSLPITPQVAARLDLPSGTTALSPNELVRAVLQAPVDLFWNGGVRTYRQASTEAHRVGGGKAHQPRGGGGPPLRGRVVRGRS